MVVSRRGASRRSRQSHQAIADFARTIPLLRPAQAWNTPYADKRVMDYVEDFRANGFEVEPLPPDEVAYQIDEELERLKGAGKPGTFGQLSKFVAQAYKRGASLRSLALLVEQRTGTHVSVSMIEQLLAEHDVPLRREDPAPFIAIWDKRDSVEQKLEALKAISEDEADYEALAKQVRSQAQPVAVQLFTGSPPWADGKFAATMRGNLAGLHASSQDKVNGLAFESVLATSLQEAGYDVAVFTPGNPGADLELALNNQQVLEAWSLKSDASKTAKSHGSINMASLAPHHVGHVPKTYAEFEQARQAALDHLQRYERITFLQCVEEPFPFQHHPDEEPEQAWRYNVIDVPKADVERAISALGEEEFKQALEQQGSVLSIPIRDSDDNETFNLKIGAKGVGITAVKPAFYEPQMSFWTTPPGATPEKPRQA